jgi:hypothetical protein
MAVLKPDVAAFVTTRRWCLGLGDLERGRCVGAGLVGLFVTLCGRMGSGRLMVLSSGEDGMDIMDEFRRRMVAAEESTEDLLRAKEVLSGNRGRFEADGVVGVSIGDCCCSCILHAAFVLSDGDECSGGVIWSFGNASRFQTDSNTREG